MLACPEQHRAPKELPAGLERSVRRDAVGGRRSWGMAARFRRRAVGRRGSLGHTWRIPSAAMDNVMSVVSGPAIVVRVGDLSSPPGVEAMALARSGMNAARAAVRAASERAEAARLALTGGTGSRTGMHRQVSGLPAVAPGLPMTMAAGGIARPPAFGHESCWPPRRPAALGGGYRRYFRGNVRQGDGSVPKLRQPRRVSDQERAVLPCAPQSGRRSG